jgi:hypothetical protein
MAFWTQLHKNRLGASSLVTSEANRIAVHCTGPAVGNPLSTRFTNAQNADMQVVCGYASAATRAYQNLYQDRRQPSRRVCNGTLQAVSKRWPRQTQCALSDAVHALLPREVIKAFFTYRNIYMGESKKNLTPLHRTASLDKLRKKLKSVQKHCIYFRIYDLPRLCRLGNEMDCCSVDHCWLVNTEQKLNRSNQ